MNDQEQQTNIETMLTVRQTAALLQLTPLTIYEYIRLGKLKAVKFGRYYRIRKEDLNDFINSHKFTI